MTTLIFLLTFITLLVLLIRLIIKALRHKPVKPSLTPVPLGTDVCFDDWCATITQIEKGPALKEKLPALTGDSLWIVLQVKMSNHARGIAQKPSEPRIHLVDGHGNYWGYSATGQKVLERRSGKQAAVDSRLELHQSLETQLVFSIPANAKNLKVLIEEGPFITKLLFPEDQEVFLVP